MNANPPPDPHVALVTGASGFIGAHLCRHLLRHGVRVVGVGRAHPERLPEGVVPRTADLADPRQVDQLLRDEKPDVVYHLASCVTGGRGPHLVRATFDANLASTVHLLSAAAEQANCRRFVLTGSLEEPDSVRDAPSSPYAASKLAASAYARMFHALYDFPAVVARVFMVYGPDQKDQTKLVPYVVNSLLDGHAPKMSSGTRQVDWIYVQDVVEGLVRLAHAPNLDGQTVDLGTGSLASVRDVVERIARLMDSPVPLAFDPAADRPMEQVRVADVAQSLALAGWAPRVSLDEGLLATIDWHRRRRASLP
jgi:UDP-glucose 4-epimerase